ncbi:hypothetical protein P20311_3536 [Pseudoalteromonas sp. BSi20311]|jgi:hypothetical protein|nr:hypothetical protein P20311_3536 [Pseudoalteromonas sp. BSi20311]
MVLHKPVCKKRMLVFEWVAKLTMPLQTYRRIERFTRCNTLLYPF